MRKFKYWLIPLAALFVFGCRRNVPIDEECSVGDERCACYEDDTCNIGLTCLSDVCVNINDTNSVGSSSDKGDDHNDTGDVSSEKNTDNLGEVFIDSGIADGQMDEEDYEDSSFADVSISMDSENDSGTSDDTTISEGDSAVNSSSAGSSGIETDNTIAGSGIVGAAGNSLGNTLDKQTCRLTCDEAALPCGGFCMTYLTAASKNECDTNCTQNKESCYALCGSGDYGIVPILIGCHTTCSSSGASCNSLCLTQFDPAAKESCENACIQDMKSCATQC